LSGSSSIPYVTLSSTSRQLGILETSAIRSDAMPRMLTRPQNVVQLAAGRQVVLARDVHGQIWQWCRENKAIEVILGGDRPFLHHDDRVHHRQHHHHPVPTASVHAKGTHATVTAINAPITTSGNRDNVNAALGQQGRARTSDPVAQISSGWDICAALTRSGRLFAWGPSQLEHQQQTTPSLLLSLCPELCESQRARFRGTRGGHGRR